MKRKRNTTSSKNNETAGSERCKPSDARISKGESKHKVHRSEKSKKSSSRMRPGASGNHIMSATSEGKDKQGRDNKRRGRKRKTAKHQNSQSNSPRNETPSVAEGKQQPPILEWRCRGANISVEAEEKVSHFLIKWPKNERGMVKDQPHWRVKQIRSACGEMSFLQACSLRRHCLKLLNPQKTMTQLGLGDGENIRHAAALFEDSLQKYLACHKIEFLTEKEQKMRGASAASWATPDFLLPRPVELRRYHKKKQESSRSGEITFTINWIDAKMFYGASIIPQGANSAVGNLIKTARKYNEAYGPGAMVFMYGCGEGLAQKLLNECGVIVLDSYPLHLEQVQEHQRTWCANDSGEIML